MRADALHHLTDEALLLGLKHLIARDRTTTSALLAHIAEVDARRLYAPAGYPSMFTYCVEHLGFSEDAAYSRIYVARASRQIPAILDAIADGRVHLTGARLLAPYLTPENATELLSSAAKTKRKSEIEALLAERFPVPSLSGPEPLKGPLGSPAVQLVLEQVEDGSSAPEGRSESPAEATSAPPLDPDPGSNRSGLSQDRFHLHVRIGRATHEKLQYAQALLSHAIPSGDVEQVLDRALDALIRGLERRKFAATRRPRSNSRPAPGAPSTVDGAPGAPATVAGLGRLRRAEGRRGSRENPRYVPASVRRVVWKRDQGRCTFIGLSGHRCRARRFLEFDHADPVARGGRPTVERMRLRCRAHNQYEAERVFGRAFMRVKRAVARMGGVARSTQAARTVESGRRAEGPTLDPPAEEAVKASGVQHETPAP